MKKLFLIYILSSLVFFSKAQTPNVFRSSPVITVSDARLRAALNFGIPVVADTLNAVQGGNDSVGLIIYVRVGARKGVWYRDTVLSGGHRWILLASTGIIYQDSTFVHPSFTTDSLYMLKNGTNTLIKIFDRNCGLISPGTVTYDSLFVFTVSPAIYTLCSDGIRRTSNLTSVTLAASDATFDRRDAIILNSSGVAVLTGTPAATPVDPQIAPNQILLTYITVPAGAVSIPCNSITIYDENSGSEWPSTGSSGVTINVDNTTNPYHLAKSVNVGSFTNFNSFRWAGTGVTLRNYTYLKFHIRLKSAFTSSNFLKLVWGTPAGNTDVFILNGQYGFNFSTVGTYQTIIIPMDDFPSPTAAIAFQMSISSSISLSVVTGGSNADGFYMDYVQLGGGSCITPTPSPSGGDFVTSVFKKSLTDSVFYVINGQNIFAFRDSGSVRSFSSGNLSPLFTTSVATATTTPAQTFALSNTTAYTVFGRATGTGAPSYVSLDTNYIATFSTKVRPLFSVSTTGISGAATYNNLTGVFNIPQYNNIDSLFGLQDNVATSDRLFTTGSAYTLYLTGSRSGTTGGVLQVNTTATTGTDYAAKFVATGSAISLLAEGDAGINLQSTVNSGTAIYGSASSGLGGQIFSISGTGLQVSSASGVPMKVTNFNGGSTNDVSPVLWLVRETASTAANGLGGSADLYLKPITGGDQIANQLIWKWVDATTATRTSEFLITGVNSATTETYVKFKTGGLAIVNNLADTLATKAYARSVGGGGGSSGITIGTTTITSGTDTRVLYNNSGVVGEYVVSGTGNVALTTSPTFTTPILGTPTSVTLTNGTGLPIATGVSGLGTGVATFLATPSSANLISAVTDETGTGALVFANTPTLVTPILGTPTSGTLTNATGLPISTGVSGLGTGVATFLATPSSANLASAVTGETGTGALVFGTSPDFTTGATIGSVAIPTISSTSTFTNKTLTSPIINVGSDATGDIYYRNSGGAFTRLAAGTNGHVLTLASGLPSWAASAGGSSYWSKTGNTIYPTTTNDSIGLGTTTVAASPIHATFTGDTHKFITLQTPYYDSTYPAVGYVSTTMGRFTMGDYSIYNGVNADGRPNTVFMNFGYNYNASGARINSNEIGARSAFEAHYMYAGLAFTEYHVFGITTLAGSDSRTYSIYQMKGSGFADHQLEAEKFSYTSRRTGTPGLIAQFRSNRLNGTPGLNDNGTGGVWGELLLSGKDTASFGGKILFNHGTDTARIQSVGKTLSFVNGSNTNLTIADSINARAAAIPYSARATLVPVMMDSITGRLFRQTISGGGLTTGTTTIASGVNTKVLFNNSGVLGEYTISGSGNVAMTTSPVFTTPNIGTATGSVSGNAGTATALQNARTINGTSFDGTANITLNVQKNSVPMYAALGSVIKGEPIYSIDHVTTSSALTSQRIYFIAVYLPQAATLTGTKWWQANQGAYTSDNYNGVALYSYSGGTLTLVASSTNDGDIWKASGSSWGSKAFSSTYAAAAGLYFVAALYCSSAQTTAPTIGQAPAMVSNTLSLFDFTNSAKLFGTISTQTALPTPTQAISGVATGFSVPLYFGVY